MFNDIDNLFAQKTPISLLNELCNKRKVPQPTYDLESADGKQHEKIFIFRVQAGGQIANGRGRKKQIARHMAARFLLETLVQLNDGNEWKIHNDVDKDEALEIIRNMMPEIDQEAAELGVPGFEERKDENDEDDVTSAFSPELNPISLLQEMVMRNKWPTIAYEVIKEEGEAHERNFLLEVRIGKHLEYGEGRTKKLAKRLAAEKMLKFIESVPEEEFIQLATLSEEIDENAEDILGNSQSGEKFNENEFKPTDDRLMVPATISTSVTAALASSADRDTLRSLVGRALYNETPQIAHLVLLRRVCIEEQWEMPVFQNLPRRDKMDLDHCLLHVKSYPVVICHGWGGTMEFSQCAAARNALELLINFFRV